MLYVDPLGKVTELDYSNKINRLRQNNILNEARLNDMEKRNISININLFIYSIIASIFILMVLVLLRKLNG